MSEFKKNPVQVLRTAGEKPVAELSHNRSAFYMVTPRLFEALVEEMANRDLDELVRRRLAVKDQASQAGYCLVYTVEDDVLVVLVLAVNKREDMVVYRAAIQRLRENLD